MGTRQRVLFAMPDRRRRPWHRSGCEILYNGWTCIIAFLLLLALVVAIVCIIKHKPDDTAKSEAQTVPTPALGHLDDTTPDAPDLVSPTPSPNPPDIVAKSSGDGKTEMRTWKNLQACPNAVSLNSSLNETEASILKMCSGNVTSLAIYGDCPNDRSTFFAENVHLSFINLLSLTLNVTFNCWKKLLEAWDGVTPRSSLVELVVKGFPLEEADVALLENRLLIPHASTLKVLDLETPGVLLKTSAVIRNTSVKYDLDHLVIRRPRLDAAQNSVDLNSNESLTIIYDIANNMIKEAFSPNLTAEIVYLEPLSDCDLSGLRHLKWFTNYADLIGKATFAIWPCTRTSIDLRVFQRPLAQNICILIPQTFDMDNDSSFSVVLPKSPPEVLKTLTLDFGSRKGIVVDPSDQLDCPLWEPRESTFANRTKTLFVCDYRERQVLPSRGLLSGLIY